MSIKIKISILLSVAVAIFFSASMIIIRSQWSSSISEATARTHKESARLMADWVSDVIDKEAAIAKAAAGASEADEVSVGDVVRDDSSGLWSLPIIVSVKSDKKEPAKISRTLIDISKLCKPLEGFKSGATGVAALADDKSYLIYYPGAEPFTNKLCSYDDLQRVLSSTEDYALIDSAYMKHGRTFVAYTRVFNPFLRKKGINWIVFVLQDAQEVYAPLKRLVSGAASTGIFFVVVAVLAGFLLGGMFLKPMERIAGSMKRFGRGDLDTRIDRISNDEIGDLAVAFNDMADELNITTVSKSALHKEAEAKRQAEEKAGRIASEFSIAMSEMESMIKTGGYGDKLAKEAASAYELAKTESGKMELHPVVIDIKSLLKKTVFVYEPKIREKGLDFKIEIPKGEVSVNVDSNKIVQALNILMESVIVSAQKGRIEISAKEAQNDIECSITYSGTPLSEEDHSRAISLAIVRRIIESHSGTFSCSKDPFGDNCITFRLPKHKK